MFPRTKQQRITMDTFLTFYFYQYEVRLKTIAQTQLKGKKKNWLFQDRWIGDEMADSRRNSKAAQFIKSVRGISLIP